jgi:hypothetical protein
MRRFVRSSQESKIISSELKSVTGALQRVNETSRMHAQLEVSFV